MATKNNQAAKPVKNMEEQAPEAQKAATAPKAVPEKKTKKAAVEAQEAPQPVVEKKSTKKAADIEHMEEPVAAPVKKEKVAKAAAIVAEPKAEVKEKPVKAPKVEKVKEEVPNPIAVVKEKPAKTPKTEKIIEEAPAKLSTAKKSVAKKDEMEEEPVVLEDIPEIEPILMPKAAVKTVAEKVKPEPKPAAEKKSPASKSQAKPIIPAKPMPIPARPMATPAARTIEKKPTVIIAHRKLENKLALPKEPGNTMVSYQPETYRSILDEHEQPQGPVYRYSDEELMEFRDLITNRLESARKELNYLQGLITRKDEAGTEDTENRFMNMEDGSGAMEREQLAQLASRQIQFINHLEKAMVRIENKTYGICRVTGKLIDKARLRAVPHATLSIEAKKTMATKQN